MAKEICISSTPHETRLAILEDDQLAEIYYERENEYTLAGSIYNGRVTRVLPGMQSAFVDVGLERDAFLYVTDFMELEDSEETDELEKAASTGANQPPREVRHGQPADVRGGRPAPKPEQKPEARPAQLRPAQEKPAPERRLTVESVPEAEIASLPAAGSFSFSEPAEGDLESGEPGAKRWRGRRRRRGGRGAANQQESQAEIRETPKTYVEEVTESEPDTEPEVAPEIQASGERPSSQRWTEPAQHSEGAPGSAPLPFVMPGESLSRYGGARAEGAPTTASTELRPPARPKSSFKPATLIESPIQWDGSGLLPGESLSRHGKRQAEPAPEVQIEAEAEARESVFDAHEAVEALQTPSRSKSFLRRRPRPRRKRLRGF